jgi:hypothetical protein
MHCIIACFRDVALVLDDVHYMPHPRFYTFLGPDLVILSAVPLLTFIQALSQSLASPLLNPERSEAATAATLVDRTLLPSPQ